MSKKITEISAGSMADIAFLLLIFFLVTTTMDVDIGIIRKLPPPVEDPSKSIVEERNILKIWINKSDRILVNETELQITELRKMVKAFLENPDFRNSESPAAKPEKKPKKIPELGEVVYVSKGIVSIKNDRGTSYKIYVKVQNEITAAINELRNEFAEKHFGLAYKSIYDINKQDAVRKLFPMAISEAEPVKAGGM